MPEIDIKGSYSVIITGLRSESQEVKKKFIFGMNKIFKVSPNKVERILESCPRLVKRDLDKEKAEKLKEILEKIGAVVEIRTPLINEETTSTMTFAEEITELMEGSKKDKEGEKEDKKEDLDKKQTTSTITLGKRVDFDKSPQYKKRMVCPKCNLEQPEAPECIRCGIIIDKYEKSIKEKEAKEKKKFENICPRCEYNNHPEATYCIKCGAKLKKAKERIELSQAERRSYFLLKFFAFLLTIFLSFFLIIFFIIGFQVYKEKRRIESNLKNHYMISSTYGLIKIKKAEKNVLERAKAFDVVDEGDTIIASEESEMDLYMGQGVMVRVSGDTYVKIKSKRSQKLSKLFIKKGSILVKCINPLKGLEKKEVKFVAITPLVEVKSKGTTFFVQVDADGLTKVAVGKGEIRVKGILNKDINFYLFEGFKATITKTDMLPVKKRNSFYEKKLLMEMETLPLLPPRKSVILMVRENNLYRFVTDVPTLVINSIKKIYSKILSKSPIVKKAAETSSPEYNDLRQDFAYIKQQLNRYYKRHNSFPNNLSKVKRYEEDPFKDLIDPWGQQIKYQLLDNNRYKLISFGKDKVENTKDDFVEVVEAPKY